MEKPAVQLVGTDGQVNHVIGKVRRALIAQGEPDRADEFTKRATSAQSYDEVLQLVFEYVRPF